MTRTPEWERKLERIRLSEHKRKTVRSQNGASAVVEPHRSSAGPPRYRIEDLLAQCDLDAPFNDEDKAWLNMPNVGREIIK